MADGGDLLSLRRGLGYAQLRVLRVELAAARLPVHVREREDGDLPLVLTLNWHDLTLDVRVSPTSGEETHLKLCAECGMVVWSAYPVMFALTVSASRLRRAGGTAANVGFNASRQGY